MSEGTVANSLGDLGMMTAMATRNAANLPGRPDKCTDFQLHVGRGTNKNVVDFTERKLIGYALRTKDAQQRLTLMAMVEDYVKGNIAVAWKRGSPVYIRVTKDAAA